MGLLRHRTRYHARRVIKSSPALYMAISRLRHRQGSIGGIDPSMMMEPRVLNRDSQIVIEGPRRSGNTFAVVAFQIIQPGPVEVAHHLHAAAQVVHAVKRKLPCMVLLRDPEETVVSTVASFPPTSVNEALDDYVSFYERLMPYRYGIIVATFDQVTTDFGDVISTVNGRYGTDFALFDHTEENVARCFQLIEQRYEHASKAAHTIARPSRNRHQHKEALRQMYLTGTDLRDRDRAQQLFDVFRAGV